MRIPVTRNFDVLDIIGSLTLRDGVEIPPDSVFSLAYTILEGPRSKPTKIHVESVSLIPDSSFSRYLVEQEQQAEEKPMPEQEQASDETEDDIPWSMRIPLREEGAINPWKMDGEPIKLVDASGVSLPVTHFTWDAQAAAVYAVLIDEQWQKLEALIRQIVSEEKGDPIGYIQFNEHGELKATLSTADKDMIRQIVAEEIAKSLKQFTER